MSTKNEQKKILIVEDDPHLLKVYEMQFEKLGFNAVTASESEASIDILGKEDPDIIIIDLMISRKDGFWLTEEIRKIKKFSKTPIILISILSQSVDKKRASDLGVTEYLVKADSSIEDVVDKIKSYL